MFVRLSENYNLTLIEWNHDVDHVHIMFKAHPNTEMKNLLMLIKVQVLDSSRETFHE